MRYVEFKANFRRLSKSAGTVSNINAFIYLIYSISSSIKSSSPPNENENPPGSLQFPLKCGDRESRRRFPRGFIPKVVRGGGSSTFDRRGRLRDGLESQSRMTAIVSPQTPQWD